MIVLLYSKSYFPLGQGKLLISFTNSIRMTDQPKRRATLCTLRNEDVLARVKSVMPGDTIDGREESEMIRG